MFINETIQTKVEKEYDVAVCGGGGGRNSGCSCGGKTGEENCPF